jgi:hypothetical protein
MSIFVCWSGDRSHELAGAVQELLQKALKLGSESVFISDRIEKGMAWFDWIVLQLEKSKAGVVCLTAENVGNPWLHFESGALALGLARHLSAKADGGSPPGQQARSAHPRNRLFPLLHGITGAELRGPLGAYQATSTTRRDLEEMIQSIAGVLGIQSGNGSLIDDAAWNGFEGKLNSLTIPCKQLIPDLESLFQRGAFNEPLSRYSNQDWFCCYDGALLAREQLSGYRQHVRAACPKHEQAVFEMLLGELDGYATEIQSHLLAPASAGGSTTKAPDAPGWCETRRLAIRSLSGLLLCPPESPPLRGEATRFMAAETDEERKTIVLGLEGEVRPKRDEVYEGGETPELFAQAIGKLTKNVEPTRYRQSFWDLDRIYYYAIVRYFVFAALRWKAGAAEEPHPLPHDWFCAARDVTMEVERYRLRSKGASLLPLKYALLALQRINRKQPAERVEEARHSVAMALQFIDQELPETERDASPLGAEIGRILANFDEAAASEAPEKAASAAA